MKAETQKFPLSDPAARKSHFTTRVQRQRLKTGEFQEWLRVDQRVLVAEAMERMAFTPTRPNQSTEE